MDTLVKNASETKNRELAGTKERTTRKKWNASKIAAIVTGLAIVGFTFADALNGHGQKDNPNLNPLAVGSGSGSGSGGLWDPDLPTCDGYAGCNDPFCVKCSTTLGKRKCRQIILFTADKDENGCEYVIANHSCEVGSLDDCIEGRLKITCDETIDDTEDRKCGE